MADFGLLSDGVPIDERIVKVVGGTEGIRMIDCLSFVESGIHNEAGRLFCNLEFRLDDEFISIVDSLCCCSCSSKRYSSLYQSTSHTRASNFYEDPVSSVAATSRDAGAS